MTTYVEARTPRTLAAMRSARLTALSNGGAPVAGWSDNAPQRIQVDHDSQVLVDESVIRAAIAKMIDLSELASMDDDWCDAFAAWFGETRIPAIAAVWDVSLTIAAANAPLDVDASTVIQIQTSTVILEAAQAAKVTLSASSTPTPYTETVRFRARAAGTVGNSLGGSAKLIAGPAGLSFANPVPFTSGRDAETNAAMIARCLGKWARLGAGWTKDAFDYFVPTAAPTVTRWRVKDYNPAGTGTTGVIVANASGPATTQERDDVDAYLNDRSIRSNGSNLAVVSKATSDPLTITITVVGDGTNANLQSDIEDALQALCDAIPLGPATLDDSLVRAVALGGGFSSIPIDVGSGETQTIQPDLPGFSGAVSISLLSLASPHDVPLDGVLVVTLAVTVA
jgi:hypothetical protein